MARHLMSRLIYAQRLPIVGRLLRIILRFNGVDVPPGVLIGKNIIFPHCAMGVAVDPQAKIHDDVLIFQHTVVGGHASIWDTTSTAFKGVTIERGAIICPGAAIITDTSLVVGEGSVVGANAVLTQSTGPWEVWAGSPARRVGERPGTDPLAVSMRERVAGSSDGPRTKLRPNFLHATADTLTDPESLTRHAAAGSERPK